LLSSFLSFPFPSYFYFKFSFDFLSQIISLENKLKKEGYLNKIHEVKEFWDFITVPENLEDVMADGKNH